MMITECKRNIFYIEVCYGNAGGGSSGSSRSTTYGGRGGPKSQEQAVRDAQRYHATGSFADRTEMSNREWNTYVGAAGGFVTGSMRGGGLVGGAIGAAIGGAVGYLSR